MYLKQTNGRLVTGLSAWAVELTFWFFVAAAVLTGAFFLRHDLSTCSSEVEAHLTD